MNDFIGIFDSGIGGLSVYDTIHKELPNENIVYLADEANCPYGIKTKEEVRQITIRNIKTLFEMGAKIVVIACNTATSSIIDLIEQYPTKLIGVIQPTAFKAKEVSKGSIGLLATNLTVRSEIYKKYLGDELKKSENASDFVPRIEAHDYDSDEMKRIIRNHTSQLKDVDTVILGCTHFKFIEKQIQEELPNATLIDSGLPTYEVLDAVLTKENLKRKNTLGKVAYYTTGNQNTSFEQLSSLGFQFDEVKHLDVSL